VSVLGAYVDRVVARVLEAPADAALLQPNAVVGTIFNGAAGVALFLVEVARLGRADEPALRLADRWLAMADEWARTASFEDWLELPRGFVFGASGIAYVDALLGAARNDAARVEAAVARIEAHAERFDELASRKDGIRASGLLAGEAGVAVAARLLRARLPAEVRYEPARARLEALRARLVRSVRDVQGTATLAQQPDTMLGMGHGVAGELFVLAAEGARDATLLGDAAFQARVRELGELRLADASEHVFWLAQQTDENLAMVESWCNGTTGHLVLWTALARAGSDYAAARARETAASTAFLLSRSSGICCGLAGQALALQRYAEVAGDARYKRLSYARLRRAMQLAELDPGRAFGFWQGALGVALVALGRLRRETAFPCVEVPLERGRRLVPT
jgi:lantibiotic modifying enzyme